MTFEHSGLTHEKKEKELTDKFKPDSTVGECDNCCICLNKMLPRPDAQRGGEDALASIECNHQFHEKCIVEWMNHKTVCPLCYTETNLYDTNKAELNRSAEKIRKLLSELFDLHGASAEIIALLYVFYLIWCLIAK